MLPKENCVMCGKPVKMIVYQGSGVCSGKCDQRRVGDMQEAVDKRRKLARKARKRRTWHIHVSKTLSDPQKGVQP